MDISNREKKIILIGASGLAKEIIDTINEINKIENKITLLGIIDDNKNLEGKTFYNQKIIGTSERINEFFYDDIAFFISFCSIKNFLKRGDYVLNLINKYNNIRFANIIHPTSWVSPSVSIGQGNFIARNVVISSDAMIGNNNVFHFNSIIGRNVNIGDNNFFSASINVTSGVTIRKNTFISAKSTITSNLNENVLLAAGTTVRSNIEKNSIVYSEQ